MNPTALGNRFQNTHRLLAIVSLSMLLFGKSVHLDQECGSCRSVTGCTDSSTDQPEHCPFGCSHHTHAGDSEDEQSPKPESGHDEHHCSVCQVIAQAPGQIAIACVVEEPEYASEVIHSYSESLTEGHHLLLRSRGPPNALA